MRLLDVGQSSAVVAEAEALAEIADILGHTADATLLRRSDRPGFASYARA